MRLYNTLTKQLEDFKPLHDSEVKFYHCGPTVYWTQHIGNMRAMTMGDLIRRSLIYLGYDVTYVRNYTDVGHLTSDADEGEDKMEKGAKREGLTPDEIADKYIKIFEDDIAELNILEPDVKEKATECIDEIIEMVKTLISKGYAYETDKAVYFDVTKAEDYPAFSTKKLEDEQAGAGKGDVQDPNKKHPADFAVWFFRTGAHKNALQHWPSPFKSKEVEGGEGFPGWHIECSAIARRHLGDTFDIHMGGVEHIAIHHPNEIAQSEAANDAKFVNYWLHNEHLNVNDRKMAKSEGTGYSLAEIKEKGFDPLDLRYFFLSAHYRSKQNFTWEALEAAKNASLNLVKALRNLPANESAEIDQEFKKRFEEAISDDANIPKALATLWDVFKSNVDDSSKRATILDFDNVLGLRLADELDEKKHEIDVEGLEKLIAQREEARKNKDFPKSDELRDQIEKDFNVKLKDSPDGVTWEIN